MTGISPSSPTAPNSNLGSSSIHGGIGGASGSTMVTDSPLLLQQIANLKAGLRKEKYEKWDLMSSDIKRKLASLRPLNADDDFDQRQEKINRLYKESEKLRMVSKLSPYLKNRFGSSEREYPRVFRTIVQSLPKTD